MGRGVDGGLGDKFVAPKNKPSTGKMRAVNDFNSNSDPAGLLTAGSWPKPQGRTHNVPVHDASAQDIPAHDFATAEAFLHLLDLNAEDFTFVLLPDRPNGSKPIQRHCALAAIWPDVLRLNAPERNYGVFVTINETDGSGDRKTKNIVRARTLVADADGPEAMERAEAIIAETGGEPSMRVPTSAGRCHYYYLSNDIPLDQFAPLQKALAVRLGTDPAVCDLPRVMRLPGTLHLKGEPQFVTLHVGDPCYTYETQMIVNGFPLDLTGKVVPMRPAGASASRLTLSQSALLKGLPFESLGEGIDGGWFDKLNGDAKDEGLKQMLGVLPDVALGGRNEWLDCLMAAHASGAPHAEDIARDWSKLGGDKYCDDAKFDDDWNSFTDKPDGITIGTLIKLASERGVDPTGGIIFDANAWRAYADSAPSDAQTGASHSSTNSGAAHTPKSSLPRAPFMGGVYPPQLSLNMMNANYAIVKFNVSGEVVIVRHGDGPPVIMRQQDAALELSNVYVKTTIKSDQGDDPEGIKLIYPWWKGNKGRNRTRVEDFDPKRPLGIACGPDQFNFWQGFAVKPIEGDDKIQRLLQHIAKIICDGDIIKWKYLTAWLAWVVQNPGRHPEVAIVLQSIKEGPGKSLLGELMVRIFGEHGFIINDPDQLFGSFTGHLEFTCFALLEEALLAGDPRINDKVKQRLTGNYVPINPKGRQARKVPNRMAAMLCTQHVWAVPAGAGARRWFVLAVSEDRIGDKAYFKAIHDDLADGGDGQFLSLLLRVDLKGWHPRHPPKTFELAQQQLMSLPSVYRWLWQCAEVDCVVCRGHAGGTSYGDKLGTTAGAAKSKAAHLRDGYHGWAKERGVRAENEIIVGRMLTTVLGSKQRGTTKDDRDYYYSLPDSDELKRRILKAQKIDAPADKLEEF
jgi:Primase C terminal 2 (PriCT-2)/Family of unknown function (DUF5906)